MAQVRDALAPGGLLFVTVPALKAFWSWNDEAVGHQRRYARADFQRLADASGLRLLDARYFMFLLSPLLWLGRQAGRPSEKNLSREELWNRVERAHRLPSPPVNSLLSAVFTLETPMGHMIRFPWGTSLLAVLQKPADADREDPSPPHKGFAP